MPQVTEILSMIHAGDLSASEQLMPLVYEELRRIARAKLAREKLGQTLQATELVHEAYLRLVDIDKKTHWNGRDHFFGAAAEAMRRILIDVARRKAAVKNGGGLERVELEEIAVASHISSEQLLVLDDALNQLEGKDLLAANVFKLRFFSGLSLDEAAEVMNISRSATYEHWTFARAWLRLQL